MSCTKKITCDHCNGDGKITVYERESEHRIAVYLNDGKEYERPSWRETCPKCNGRGKVIVDDHDLPSRNHDSYGTFMSPRKCRKCGNHIHEPF